MAETKSEYIEIDLKSFCASVECRERAENEITGEERRRMSCYATSRTND